MNSKGPNIEPWGTPDLIPYQEKQPSFQRTTICFLFF